MARSLAFLIALLFLVLTTEAVAACSISSPNFVQVRCGNQEARFSDYQWAELDRGFADISVACGENPEALKQLIDVGVRRTKGLPAFHLTRWSRLEEIGYWIGKQQFTFGECYYRDYDRVGAWLVSFQRQRIYCYDVYAEVGGMCPRIQFSPLGFTLYIFTRMAVGTIPYFLLVALPLGLALGYLAVRRELRKALRPRMFSAVVSIVSAICWFGYILDPFDPLALTLSPILGLDLLFLALCSYLILSLLAYFAEYAARYRTSLRTAE